MCRSIKGFFTLAILSLVLAINSQAHAANIEIPLTAGATNQSITISFENPTIREVRDLKISIENLPSWASGVTLSQDTIEHLDIAETVDITLRLDIKQDINENDVGDIELRFDLEEEQGELDTYFLTIGPSGIEEAESIASDGHILSLARSSVAAGLTLDPTSKAGYIEERKDSSNGKTETLRSFGFTAFPDQIKLGESFSFNTQYNTSAHITYPEGTFPPCLDQPSSEPNIYGEIKLFSESWHKGLNSNAQGGKADSQTELNSRFLAHHCDSPKSRAPMSYSADATLSIDYQFIEKNSSTEENETVTVYHYKVSYSGKSENATGGTNNSDILAITVRDKNDESGQIASTSNGLAVSAGEKFQIGNSSVTLFYEIAKASNNSITAFVNPSLEGADDQDDGKHVLNLIAAYAPKPFTLNKEQSLHWDEYTLNHEDKALGLSRRILDSRRVGENKTGGDLIRRTTTEESMGFTNFPEEIVLGTPFSIEVGLRAQMTMTNRWCVGNEVRTPKSYVRLRTRDTWVRSAYRTSYHAHDAVEFSCADTSQLLSEVNLGADSTMNIECTPLENDEIPGETVAAAYRVLYEYECKVESKTLSEYPQNGNKVAFYWPLVESDSQGNFKSENDIALNSHVLIETGFSSIPGPSNAQEIVLEYAPANKGHSSISASPYQHPFELKPDWQQPGPGSDSEEARGEESGNADNEANADERDKGEDSTDEDTGNTSDADQTRPDAEADTTVGTPDTDPNSVPIAPGKPDIAQHIADWIAKAEPPINATENAQVRYNNRGNFVGKTQSGTIEDRHDTGAFDPVFLWNNKRGLDSVNHCTMEEYVNKQVAGEGLEDCKGRYKPSTDKPDQSDSDKPTIPNVVGLGAREAAEQIQTATGIRPRIVLGKPAPTLNQSRTVANVTPKPGSNVGKDDKITITVYAPAQAVIPDVIGLDAKAAVEKIKSATNIRPRVVLGQPASDKTREKTVASVNPKPGTKVNNNDKITITVFAPVKVVPPKPKPDPIPNPQEVTPIVDKPDDKPDNNVKPSNHPCATIASNYEARDATWNWYSFFGAGGSNWEINGFICTSQGYYTYSDNQFRSYDCGKDFTSQCVKSDKFNAKITEIKEDGKGSTNYTYQYANGKGGWGKRTPNKAQSQKPDSTPNANADSNEESESHSPARVDHPTQGIYTTSYGDMDFKTSGPYTATYSTDEGRIIGSLSGDTLGGIWVEKSSGQKCKTQRDGSYYWGLVKFSFTSDFNEFKGLWSYCNNPLKSRQWNGKRKNSKPLPPKDETLGSSFEPGVDRPGSDIKASFHTPSAQACRKACQDNAKCKSFTWVKPNTIQGPKGRCWIKHSVPKTVNRNCCISGVIEGAKTPSSQQTAPSASPSPKPETNQSSQQIGQWIGKGKGLDKIEGKPVLGTYQINFNIAANNTANGKISFDNGFKPVALKGKLSGKQIALRGSYSETDDEGYTFTYTVKLNGTLNAKNASGTTDVVMPDLVCVAEAIGSAIGSAVVPFGEEEEDDDTECPITSYKGDWAAQQQ